MLKRKSYDLISLANHAPSKWARDMMREYYRGGDDFTEIKSWLVTNNLSLKELKRKFKFENLPCLIITTQIASNRKSREYFYKDKIEQTIKALATKEMRRYGKLPIRKQVDSLRLRLREAQRMPTRDVIPAEDDVQTSEQDLSTVSTGKKD